MSRVEIELKIKQTPEDIEQILLNYGFTILQKVRTIANYYTNQEFSPIGLDLKDKSIRIRTSYNLLSDAKQKILFSIRNLSLFLNKEKHNQKEIKVSNRKAKALEKKLLNNDFKHILTDDKTDFVYLHPNFENNKIAFQIQNIKGLGLIVAYDNENYEDFPETEQRKKLVEDVKTYGIKIENENQINRYSTLLKKPLQLSIKKIVELKNMIFDVNK